MKETPTMKKGYILLALVMVIVVLLSCAPQPSPAQKETQPPEPVKTGAPTGEAWRAEWDKVVAAAKLEGKVTTYGIRSPTARDAIIKAVKDNYGIDVEFTAGRGSDIATKLLQERRAGLFLGDVYMGGTTTMMNEFKPAGVLDPIEPILMLPEVRDPKVWWNGDLVWIDKDKTALAFSVFVSQRIARNTDITKSEELMTYKDLLNPKWKGKIVFNDPTVSGTGERWFRVVREIMGTDYMRELAKQQPFINRDERLQVEWVARAKYPIGIALKKEIITEFQNAGAGIIEYIPDEGSGMSSGSDNVGLINRAAHPNAAKVFINWLLTKEGATIFSEGSGNLSARLDVPRGHVDPVMIPDPKKKYLFSDQEEFLLKAPADQKVAKEIFGPLITK